MTLTAREQIAHLLQGIGTGSFASRRMASADDLVLAVTGIGPLYFPIRRDQAQNLLRKARPARYGRREETGGAIVIEHHGERVAYRATKQPLTLFAQVLQVAAALESQDLAAALLRPFHLTVVTPRAARSFAALLDRYGEEWGRLLLGGWARPDWAVHAGSRDVLAWLTALRALCAGCSAARCPGGATASRLLVEEGWGALQGEIEGRRSLLPPSQRERALAALARPILGWLGGAAIVEEDSARMSPTGAVRYEGPIARAVGYLCTDDNTVLIPCLMHLLRAAAKSVKAERRGTLELDAIGRFCAAAIAARLATEPRQPDNWSIGLPAGCDCVLCHRLGAFLSDPAQRQLEWPLAKAGRQHVHQRIDRHELPVRHQTRRSGSPYTLVLEKTKTLFALEAAARRAWQADLNWLSRAGWMAPASRPRRGTR